jgi:hypothetical protein
MGKHNNATTGFKAVADKAAKEYGSKEAGERVAGAIKAKMAKAGKLEEADLDEGILDNIKMATKKLTGGVNKVIGHGTDADMMADLQKKMGVPQTGQKPQTGQTPAEPKEGLGSALATGFDKFNNAVAPIGAKLKGAKAFVTNNPKDYQAAADAHNKIAAKAGTDPRTGQPYAHPERDPRYRFAKAAAGSNEYKKGRAQAGMGRVFETGDEEGGIPMTPKQKKFAAIAEPKDKITFADKIAGAKKEVDEMLGDVAAEAMKNALSGGQKKLDKNNNGKLDANDFAMLRKGGKKQVADESFPTVAGARDEMRKRKVGDITHGAKHDTQEIPGGRRVTRRLDPNTGYSVGSDTDDEGNAKSSEKRGRGRPKSAPKGPERVTAKATKHKGGRKMSEQEIDEAISALEGCGYKVDKLEEKAVSKAQQKFMGMVHATQKGEKAPSKEVSKVAKTMKKSDATDFASTKQKGLPEKVSKKKEKTEESDTPSKGASGMTYGKGIYDSINRDLEEMISESMNVNVSMNVDEHGEPHKSITVSAEGEAAEQLAQLLNLAGMQAQDSKGGCGCETSPCACGSEELDENQPDWPTNTVTGGENDPLMHMYSGGVDGPKDTGQTTGAPYNSQPQRQGAMAEGTDLGMQLYAELKSFKA